MIPGGGTDGVSLLIADHIVDVKCEHPFDFGRRPRLVTEVVRTADNRDKRFHGWNRPWISLRQCLVSFIDQQYFSGYLLCWRWSGLIQFLDAPDHRIAIQSGLSLDCLPAFTERIRQYGASD